MTFLRARMSRRHALAATALAVCPLQASADRPFPPREPIMPPTIRPATPHDVPEVVALLTEDAKQRSALDPLLWRIAPDAQARIERGIGTALQRTEAPARELWLVAEHSDRIVGIMHAMKVPVPPIYVGAGPGLSSTTVSYPPTPHQPRPRRCSRRPRPH